MDWRALGSLRTAVTSPTLFGRALNPREYDIFLLALEGGREIPLVQHPANDAAPDWTPDGKRILFCSNRTGTMGAWLIQVAEGKPQGTPELVKPDLGLDLTPMGFTRNGSYYYGVNGDDATCTSPSSIWRQANSFPRRVWPPSASWDPTAGPTGRPDGRQLLFLSKRGPGVLGSQGALRPLHRKRRGA